MDIQEIKKIADEKGSHFFDKDTLEFFGETMKSLGTETIDGQIYVYRKFWHLPKADISAFADVSPERKKAVWRFVETNDAAEFHQLKVSDDIFKEIYTRNTENRSN